MYKPPISWYKSYAKFRALGSLQFSLEHSLDLLSNSLNLMSIEMPRDQFGEFVSGYWVLKGLTYITLTKGFSLNPKQILPHIECFDMTSRRPYWCPKTMKRQPCWCPKSVLWELNSFLIQTLSCVPINLHRCWPHEWKHSIIIICIILYTVTVYAILT